MSSLQDDGGVAVGTRSGRFGWRGWLIGHLKGEWLASARHALRRRAELRSLLALDDRTLADIGVRRAEVQGVLYGVLSWQQLIAERDQRRVLPASLVRLERRQPPAATHDLGKAA